MRSAARASSWASSSLTAIRNAWKMRLAGWPPANCAGTGIAALITSTSWCVVLRSACARADDRPAIWRRSAPRRTRAAARASRRSSHVLTISCAVSSWSGPSACPAARRRRRRSRGRTCRPASRTCPGPCTAGRRAAPSSSSAAARDEVGADEARLTGDLGREVGEALLGERVAVDADQRPAGPMRSAISRAWPPPPTCSPPRLAGLRIEQLDQLARQDRDVRLVMSSSVAKARCDVGDTGQDVLACRHRRRGSTPRCTRRSRSRPVLVEARRSVIQRGRDHHAVGGVELCVKRTR